MIEEQAKVISLEGEFAWVETQRTSTCSACNANQGCGTATLTKISGNRMARLRALNQARANAGEQVVVGLDESALVRGSLMVYVLPLLTMFGAALLGAGMFAVWGAQYSEGYRIGISLAGLLIGFAMVARFNRITARDPRYQAVVLRRAEVPVSFHETRVSASSQIQ